MMLRLVHLHEILFFFKVVALNSIMCELLTSEQYGGTLCSKCQKKTKTFLNAWEFIVVLTIPNDD